VGGPDRSLGKRLEILEALKESWDRQPGSYAYGRAIRGMVEVAPELRSAREVEALFLVPATAKILETPGEAFELRWASEALRWMDEIPSTAT
jgi:hypothetical protein